MYVIVVLLMRFSGCIYSEYIFVAIFWQCCVLAWYFWFKLGDAKGYEMGLWFVTGFVKNMNWVMRSFE